MGFLVVPLVVLASFADFRPVVAEARAVVKPGTGGGVLVEGKSSRAQDGGGLSVTRTGEGWTPGGDRIVSKRTAEGQPGMETASGSERDGPAVDVNACSFEELLRLPGIGPKKARAILEERAKRPFKSVYDLRRVKGIGPATVRKLAPHVTTGTERAR